MGSLTNLKYLFLYGKRLTGEIPSELAGQSALADLYLEGNSFSGCNPVGLQDVENNDLDLLGLIYCPSICAPPGEYGAWASLPIYFAAQSLTSLPKPLRKQRASTGRSHITCFCPTGLARVVSIVDPSWSQHRF